MNIKYILIPLIVILIGYNTYPNTNVLHIKNISADKKIVCRILSMEKIPHDNIPPTYIVPDPASFKITWRCELIISNTVTNVLFETIANTANFAGPGFHKYANITIFDTYYSEKDGSLLILWEEPIDVLGEYITAPPYPGIRKLDRKDAIIQHTGGLSDLKGNIENTDGSFRAKLDYIFMERHVFLTYQLKGNKWILIDKKSEEIKKTIR